MKIRYIFFFVFSISMMFNSLKVYAEKDKIIWLKIDAPPYYISKGIYKGEGIADKIIEIMKKKLTDYTHEEIQNVPVSRLLLKLKENENVCFVTTLKSPEKEEYIYFSLPTVINPPQAIITLKRKGSIITESNSVSLAKLLENKNIKIGIADRAYGVTLDSIIEKYKQNRNVYKRTGTDVFLGLLEMMENERIDYIIGTPYEVNYAASLLNNKLELVSVEIEETKSEKYLLSYAGFPKTPWGKKVRDQVNKILLTERETAYYHSIFNRWLDEKSIIRVNEDWKKILNTEK